MVIGTCGYSWSGSSAISDFLMEFDENQIYNEIEFILAFCPDGLDDLDYQLNSHCAKFLSSIAAIPRFRKTAHRILNKATHGQIDMITDKYIDKLVNVKWRGRAQGQEVLHGKLYNELNEFATKIIRRLPYGFEFYEKNSFPFLSLELSIAPENFIEITQAYTDKILESIGLDLSRNIVLDQPFPGNNPAISMKHYRNAKAIVVDRDPRDLYLITNKYYRKRTNSLPHESVDAFIEYYKQLHKIQFENSDDIIKIRFEDMIYEYEKTISNIKCFLKLENHSRPRSRFVPEESRVNTQLFKKCNDFEEDIKIIENLLEDYIYPFENYPYTEDNREVFDEKPIIKVQKK